MLSSRWRSMLRDLWQHKTRTSLVVISIAIGIFAFGVIAGTWATLLDEVNRSYQSSNPASATLHTETFSEDLVDSVRRMPEVYEAEGRRSIMARVQIGSADWYDLELTVVPDFNDIRVNIVRMEKGAWPPAKRTMLIERSSFATLEADVGDHVMVEMPDGQQYEMALSGLAHDLSSLPAPITGRISGYITSETSEWLGVPYNSDLLSIVVAEYPGDEQHIWRVAHSIEHKLERSGRTVSSISVPEPLVHPAEETLPALMVILSFLGTLAVLLGCFLVINTVSAILAQQTRQIGVMKAIGARTKQLVRLYLGMVLVFGLLSLLIAVPLGTIGATGFSRFIAFQLNFDIDHLDIPLWVYGLQIVIGLLVPILAALPPILSVARVTVREAISNRGVDAVYSRRNLIDRLLERIRGLPRPFLLSLRNTFRRKGRLVLTLAALVLSGAIFISVITVRTSLFNTLDSSIAARNYDILIDFHDAYRKQQIDQIVLNIPGVMQIEHWGFDTVYRKRSDGSDSENIVLYAPPASTRALKPTIAQGRWLHPEDANAVVVSSNLLTSEPDLTVGSVLMLNIDGEDYPWQVVGITQELQPPTAPGTVYVHYPYYSRLIGEVGKTRSIRVTTAQHDADFRSDVATLLDTRFEQADLRVRTITTTSEDRAIIADRFTLLTSVLAVMSVLIGVVGGLGLMGTMSINVLDRTKEIGIMRAIGASNRSVHQIVIGEGIVIGLVAWFVGTILSVPLSRAFSAQVGNQLLQAPLEYAYAVNGALLWLVLVIIIAALASFIPAYNASRITVREVLAYE